ncbi:MAG: MFS transporter [Spirochaetales bacterium]|nr:MFS transporter [Spirochaetales bacterium]
MNQSSSGRKITELPFKALILSIYLPGFLMAIGSGAVVPFLPLFARELGAEIGLTGFIVSLSGMGILLFDLPGGLLTTKIGSKKVMFVSGFALIGLSILTGLSTRLAWLGVMIFFRGITNSAWQVARLTFLRHAIPVHIRGRSLSLIGGVMRIGNFIGPIAGGYIVQYLGYQYIFFFQALLTLAGFIIFIVVTRDIHENVDVGNRAGLRGLGKVFIRQRKIFATAGSGMIALSLLRTARSIIIPLWGRSIGLSVSEIGLVFGIGSAIDMVMFIPAGQMMGRLGRKWAALVATGGIALGLFLIPLTSGFSTFLLVSLLMGLTNGMGSGINMTLGSDLAPDKSPEQFLSLWRFISDIGHVAGPLAIGGIAQVMSLAVSSLATGGLGAVGVIIMILTLPETLRRRKR